MSHKVFQQIPKWYELCTMFTNFSFCKIFSHGVMNKAQTYNYEVRNSSPKKFNEVSGDSE
jgi:hypothetical protein